MVQEVELVEFGEELRREREARGLPIEAVCDATKLRVKHVQALEAGAFSELPGGVFRRGFLRSYLKTLGLDEGRWMGRFDVLLREMGLEDSSDTSWTAFAENVKNSREGRRRRMGLRWVGVAAMLVAVLLGGWCCWRLISGQPLLPSAPIWFHVKSLVDNPASR